MPSWRVSLPTNHTACERLTRAMLDARPYRTVVADPPWQPTMAITNGGAPKASPQHHYDTLSVAEIIELRPTLAPQAHVYIWGLTQHMDWAYEVARAWDAEPVTMFTWKKPGLGAGRFRSGRAGATSRRQTARCLSGRAVVTARSPPSFSSLSSTCRRDRDSKCTREVRATDGPCGATNPTAFRLPVVICLPPSISFSTDLGARR
jgi:N6-adenosine-specific RNA methylase IME4